jgi:hypothetical protein
MYGKNRWDNVKYVRVYGTDYVKSVIGFNGKFYTFPHFLTFLLKRFLAERG